MTQNKSRDDLAENYSRQIRLPTLKKVDYKNSFKTGWDAAEKHYLGEIEELKLTLDALGSGAQEFVKRHNVEIESLKADLESAVEAIEKRNNIIQDIYDICLCERFQTYGFDYHEQHPNRKENNGGKRPFTPRDIIENRIGFEWKYSKPSGVCDSWKELKLNDETLTTLKSNSTKLEKWRRRL